jgi:hypothetical protein
MHPIGTLVYISNSGGAIPYKEIYNVRVEYPLVIPYGSIGIITEPHITRSRVAFPTSHGWIPNNFLSIVR